MGDPIHLHNREGNDTSFSDSGKLGTLTFPKMFTFQCFFTKFQEVAFTGKRHHHCIMHGFVPFPTFRSQLLWSSSGIPLSKIWTRSTPPKESIIFCTYHNFKFLKNKALTNILIWDDSQCFSVFRCFIYLLCKKAVILFKTKCLNYGRH